MATEWKKVKLGDIATNIQTGPFGSQLHMSDYSESGTPVVMPKDMINGKISEASIARVSEKHIQRLSRYVVSTGNILYARRGDVGKCAYVSEKENGWLCGTGCLNVELNKEIVDPKFLFFQLQKSETIGWVEKNAVGATMLNLNTDILSRVPISLPPLETQQKIAGILSAYDDLIENNRKQIKLLEEAAQKLYKEWFVKLNFPGYENTKIVDGVPEGWKILTVEELMGKLESGSRPKGGIDSTIKNGIASVGAENVIGLGQYNYSSEKYVSKEFYENAKRGKIEDKDILIYKDGAYIGRTSLFQDNFPHKEAMINEHVFLLHTKESIYQYFLFFTLYQKTYFEKMQKLNKNAAQPGINQDAIKSLKLLVPNLDIIESFDNFVNPIIHKIFALAKQNKELQSARDKLLPKLMNGEFV